MIIQVAFYEISYMAFEIFTLGMCVINYVLFEHISARVIGKPELVNSVDI